MCEQNKRKGTFMKKTKNQKKKLPGNQAINQLQFPGIQTAMPMEELSSPDTDPLGSYTGNPIDGGTPTQDADDL